MNGMFWNELWSLLVPILLALAAYELICVRPLRRGVADLRQDLRKLEASMRRTARLVAKLAQAEKSTGGQLAQCHKRLGQLELRSDRPYEQAIHLAAKGSGTARLVSFFGLTEGEADLVRLLHGRHPSPGSADPRQSGARRTK